MTAYEYVRLLFDFNNLSEMNRLSRSGWKVVTVVPDEQVYIALMERALPVGESSRAPEGSQP